MSFFPITKEGFQRLEKELHNLKTVQRPKIIEAIAEARAHGDLSENAEYTSAKEKQSFIEGKIKELDSKKATSQVMEFKGGNKVDFGATVVITDHDDDAKKKYKIVSDYESDIASGYISSSSPVARSLMGKMAGDTVEVETPRGIKYYDIEEIGA